MSQSDERRTTQTACSAPCRPHHAHVPDLAVDNPAVFEGFVFVYSVLCLGLQYINIYKTVWWLPYSSANYALNFYLIDAHLTVLLVLVLARRLFYCLYRYITNASSRVLYLYDILYTAKILLVLAVLLTFVSFIYLVVIKHPVFSLLFLCYPLITYLLMFHLNIQPLFCKVVLQLSYDRNYRYSRLRMSESIWKEVPVHNCSMAPEAVREEVEALKTDFNYRVMQVFFNSMFCAYYSACVPLCFTQNTLYFDIWWAGQHVAFVWLSSFLIFFVHYVPAKYLDLLHKSSLHLGRWTKMENRNNQNFTTAWSELQVWQRGVLVKHVKGLFRAEGINNCAEPGNKMHSKFYFLFHEPLRVIDCALVLVSLLVIHQLLRLVSATEWSHILSLAFLLFANYYVLFKLVRDRCLLAQAHKSDSPSSQS